MRAAAPGSGIRRGKPGVCDVGSRCASVGRGPGHVAVPCDTG